MLLPSLSALVAFERAASLGSFARAASELGRTPSAISHAIGDLEERFDCPLFRRVGRTVVLTQAGTHYLAEIRKGLTCLSRAGSDLMEQAGDPSLEVSAPPFFTSSVLMPSLGEFEERHPNIKLNIKTSSTPADSYESNVRAEIRICCPRNSALDVTPLGMIEAVPICSPKLLLGKRPLEHIADLQYATLIHAAHRPNTWSNWLSDVDHSHIETSRHLTFDTTLAAIDAARHGLGVALGVYPLIKRYPGYGDDIVLPFGLIGRRKTVYSFVCSPEAANTRKIVAFREWVRGAFKRLANQGDA